MTKEELLKFIENLEIAEVSGFSLSYYNEEKDRFNNFGNRDLRNINYNFNVKKELESINRSIESNQEKLKKEILNKSLDKMFDGAEVMIVSTNKGTFASGSPTEITSLLGTIVANLAINDGFDEKKLRVAINRGFEVAKSLRANKEALKSQNFTDFLNDLFRN